MIKSKSNFLPLMLTLLDSILVGNLKVYSPAIAVLSLFGKAS